jgi:hypothetical protein
MEQITWGKSAKNCNQGWAYRYGHYWTVHYSKLWDTHERGGPLVFDGLAWTNSDVTDYPFAVTDDFGVLVPVPRNENHDSNPA